MKDIHTHILPGVDDGSPNMQESIRMIEEEISYGVTEIVLTPHHHYRRKYLKTPSEIRKTFLLLQEEVEKRNLPIKLSLGMEIYCSSAENLPAKLDAGELLTMEGTKDILLEFSPSHQPEDLSEVIYNFQIHGYTVIIAHVERYPWMKRNTIESLKKLGCKIQVNGGSLLPPEPFKVRWFTKRLIKQGLVDYIASDIHSFRPCDWNKVKKHAKEFYKA